MAEMRADDVKELLDAFSQKIPALLNSLTDVLYGKTAAEKYGQAVSGFYKTLKDSGMTDEQAFKLTEQYMSSLNLGGLIAGAVGHRGRRRGKWNVAEEGNDEKVED
jgi:hypothetical protein